MTVLPPYELQRAWVWAFWVVFSTFVGLCAVAAIWLGLKNGTAIVAAAALIILAGWIDRKIATFCYRAWNRLSRLFSIMAERYMLWICFLLIVIVGRAGTTLRLNRPAPNESLWEPCRPDAAMLQHLRTARANDCWIELLRDAARENDRWVIVLLPFLVLLASFASEVPQDEQPGENYTLY